MGRSLKRWKIYDARTANNSQTIQRRRRRRRRNWNKYESFSKNYCLQMSVLVNNILAKKKCKWIIRCNKIMSLFVTLNFNKTNDNEHKGKELNKKGLKLRFHDVMIYCIRTKQFFYKDNEKVVLWRIMMWRAWCNLITDWFELSTASWPSLRRIRPLFSYQEGCHRLYESCIANNR